MACSAGAFVTTRFTRYGILDLSLESTQIKVVQSVEPDKFLIVCDFEADGPPDRRGHAEIHKAGIEHIEKGHTEADLDQLRQIDKVDLRLERAAAIIEPADQAGQHGKVRRLQDHVGGTFYVVIYKAVRARICEDCHGAVLHPQGGAPADSVFPPAAPQRGAVGSPFPN